jgi:membrane dipeptidase
MNKVGILIDVSHLGDQSALDAIAASKQPIIISHCAARTLMPSARMFPDGVIQAMAEKGGVIGIEAAPGTTATTEHADHTIDTFMEHVEYCIELVGIDYVGCGPDSLYGDHVGYYRVEQERLKTDGLGHYPRPERQGGSHSRALPEYVKGLENPTECLQNVTRWMVKHGYSDPEIAKVIGGNALRLLRKVW